MEHTSPTDERQAETDDTVGTLSTTSTETTETEIDPDAVADAIRTHGERIKQRELQQALRRLDAGKSLTPTQQQIIEEMATDIVDRVLAPPETALAESDDPATLRTAVKLFDPTE